MHHALGLLTVHDFPSLANSRARRQMFAKQNLKTPPAPYAFHKKRFENERRRKFHLWRLIAFPEEKACPAKIKSSRRDSAKDEMEVQCRQFRRRPDLDGCESRHQQFRLDR